ncbi:dlpC, partial [Symbiodinium necroappetens]
ETHQDPVSWRAFARFGDVLTQGAATFQLLWSRGLAVVNLYAPPGHEDDLCGGFLDLHIKHQLHNKQWLLGGDSNAVSRDSRFVNLVITAGATLCTDHKPTRWQGEHCIDWFAGTTGVNLKWAGHSEEVYSDHVLIRATFPQPGVDAELRKGRLRPMPSWEKPAAAPAETWREKLLDCWNEDMTAHHAYAEICYRFQSLQPDVQHEWDLFMFLVDELHRRTLCALAADESVLPELRDQCVALLAQPHVKNRKGTVAVHQWVNRLTFRRLLLEREAFVKLLEGVPVGLRVFTAREEAALKDKALKQWKSDMSSGNLRKLSRWIKGREVDQKSVVLVREGLAAGNRQQALEFIRAHWQSLWAQQRERRQDPSAVAATLLEGFPEGQRRQVQWQQVTAEHLQKAFSQVKGSAGPDGWTAEEVKHFPAPCVALMHQLCLRWLQAGLLPRQLREVKMVNLPKPQKIKADHTLEAGHTRPISVASIFWRIFAKAWLTGSGLLEWGKHNRHPDVVAGTLGSEAAAAELLDSFRCGTNAYLGSLDWSAAYDHLSPAANNWVAAGFGPAAH